MQSVMPHRISDAHTALQVTARPVSMLVQAEAGCRDGSRAVPTERQPSLRNVSRPYGTSAAPTERQPSLRNVSRPYGTVRLFTVLSDRLLASRTKNCATLYSVAHVRSDHFLRHQESLTTGGSAICACSRAASVPWKICAHTAAARRRSATEDVRRCGATKQQTRRMAGGDGSLTGVVAGMSSLMIRVILS